MATASPNYRDTAIKQDMVGHLICIACHARRVPFEYLAASHPSIQLDGMAIIVLHSKL